MPLRTTWYNHIKSEVPSDNYESVTDGVSLSEGIQALMEYLQGTTDGIEVSDSAEALGVLFLEENFSSGDLSGTDWYDDTNVSVSTSEYFSAPSSLEVAFSSSATTPTGLGAMRYEIPNGGSESLYISYRIKYETGWEGSGQAYHPHIFTVVSDQDSQYTGPRDTYLSAYIESWYDSGTNHFSLGLRDRLNIDTANISTDLTGVTEDRALYGCNGDTDGYGGGCFPLGGGEYSNERFWETSGEFVDDTWHRVEVYWEMNSISGGIGQTDGIIRAWLDGVLVEERTDTIFRTGSRATLKFGQVILAPYIGDGSPQAQTFWIDDIQIASARSFITAPDTPTVTASGTDDTTVDLATSAFSGGSGDSHESTDWQIDASGGDFSSPVWESLVDSSNLTSYTNAGPLSAGTDYEIRARHRGVLGGVSGWGTDTFSTTGGGVDLFATPNEPSGFAVALSEPWDSISGSYFLNDGQYSGTLEATGGYLLWSYPTGFTSAGHSPGYVYPQSAGAGSGEQYQRWVVELSSNFYGHSSGVNKFAFFDDGDDAQGIMIFAGSGNNNLHLRFNDQGWGASDNYEWDDAGNLANPTEEEARIPRGEQFQLETLISRDGWIKAWVNGVLVLHFEGLDLGTGGWWASRHEPVWGGVGGPTVPAPQWQRVYDYYVSYGDADAVYGTPNEPAGFTAELEEPWDSISGSYFVNSGQFGGSVEASGGALLFTMPNGFTLGGHAPGYVYTRDNSDHGPSQYMRHVIEVDADWVGHPELVNKLFFWSDGSAAAQGYVALHGSGSNDLRPLINTQSWAHGTSGLKWDGGTGGETNLSGISSAGAVVPRGEPFQLEVLVDTEAAGGTVKLWINGVLILHYEGIEFGDTFDNPRIEPVYGGVNGGTYSGATQYMWFHDTYVSSGSV